MTRFIWLFITVVLAANRVCAQTPLDFFTNQANAQLQAQFGFGITNIPVYCATNPAVGYSSSVHYVLQSVADAYDATTPATNLPSVFRPLFSWQSNTLYLAGYACVSNDFYRQTGTKFKTLGDPSITTNDNVWGIPWVVGAKGQIPAFNEYCYSTAINVERELFFVRSVGANGLALTNLPPKYTNQFYIMSVSNLFGAEAWNAYPSVFARSFTLIASNHTTITLTNNYNAGSWTNFDIWTNAELESWPGWNGFNFSPSGFLLPVWTNITAFPLSYWSESTSRLLPWNGIPGILPNDLEQTGHPVHQWTLTVTNNLMYALIDNATQRVLDFVNLGGFGSSLDITSALANTPSPDWTVPPATDLPNSPISEGALAQIVTGIESDPEIPLFAYSLFGRSPCYPNTVTIFGCPYLSSSTLVQNCSWQAGNPMVHYTIQDLGNSTNNQVVVVSPVSTESLYNWITGSVCNLGKVNPNYNSGAVNNLSYNLSTNAFQINFQGAADLPYAVWGSTNLVDWAQIGTATQPSPGGFQFQDPAAASYPARFYQVQLP